MPLPWTADDEPLPPTHEALPADSDAPGLLAIGPTVTPARLEEAYQRGIFPWYSPDQPPLWWSPDPRMVLRLADFRLSRSMRKTLRRFANCPGCDIRIDQNFARVVDACAQAPRHGQLGTWIVPEIAAAYTDWHRAGRAHSVETWINGELVGGLYGVAMGRMFYGESMFAWRDDASKIALAALVAFGRAQGVALIDCQQYTPHLASMGAAEMSRTAFEAHLAQATRDEAIVDWTYHSRLWEQLGISVDGQQAAVRAPGQAR